MDLTETVSGLTLIVDQLDVYFWSSDLRALQGHLSSILPISPSLSPILDISVILSYR